jgi:hypothetical protein
MAMGARPQNRAACGSLTFACAAMKERKMNGKKMPRGHLRRGSLLYIYAYPCAFEKKTSHRERKSIEVTDELSRARCKSCCALPDAADYREALGARENTQSSVRN